MATRSSPTPSVTDVVHATIAENHGLRGVNVPFWTLNLVPRLGGPAAAMIGWLAVVLLALAACSLAFSAGPRRGLAIAGRQRAFLVSPAAPLSDHFFGLLDVLSIAVAIVVSRVRGAVGGRVAALIVAGFLPGLGSLLVAVLVWPLAIASWKRQVRRA